MPTVKKIHICNYKNIESCSLVFSERINCISGDNAQGKTNLLEALYHICLCKNPGGLQDRNVCRYGAEDYSIIADVDIPGSGLTKFQYISKGGSRVLKKDDKAYERVSDHIGTLPLVMISPADIEMVNASADGRRKFINTLLCQTDKEYLRAYQQYTKLLQHRNAIIKEGIRESTVLDIITSQMTAAAEKLYYSRKELIEALDPLVKKYYARISRQEGEVPAVTYVTTMSPESLPTMFSGSIDRDLALHYTSCGPQRDDVDFSISGHSLRYSCSQGQKKSFIVALKMAQFEYMKSSFGFGPIILLDDIFDRLDYSRVVNLLKMVAESDFGQIFITDCNTERLVRLIEEVTSESSLFEVSDGHFTKK